MATPKSGISKPHEPTDITRAEVSALLSFGNTKLQICEYLNICEDTLDKYYDYEKRTAVVRANANVAKRLYNKAVAQDDLAAQIFWLKTRGRWRTADQIRDDDSNTIDDSIERMQKTKEAEKEY